MLNKLLNYHKEGDTPEKNTVEYKLVRKNR